MEQVNFAYQRSFLPLAHGSQHSSQVGLPLLLILILRVPDQICVDGLAVIVAFQSVQLDNERRESVPISRSLTRKTVKHHKIQ